MRKSYKWRQNRTQKEFRGGGVVDLVACQVASMRLVLPESDLLRETTATNMFQK